MDPTTAFALAARYDERADALEAACGRLATVAHDLRGTLDAAVSGLDGRIWAGRTADATRDAMQDHRIALRVAVADLEHGVADGRARAGRLRDTADELRAGAHALP